MLKNDSPKRGLVPIKESEPNFSQTCDFRELLGDVELHDRPDSENKVRRNKAKTSSLCYKPL